MSVSEKEVLRYLGYLDAEADEQTRESIKQISAQFTECVKPKGVWGLWECEVRASQVVLAGITITSKSLAEHLSDCDHAVLMAATLGVEADALVRRYSVLDMGKALVAQAVGAAMIEEYCDRLENGILQKADIEEAGSAKRFSPGYGDFDISYQKDIFRLLDCTKRVGLTLTDGYMMTPTKSVTAVIGLSKDALCKTDKCEQCIISHCAFREE